MNGIIDWNLVFAWFLGTSPMLAVMLWLLMKPKHSLRKELIDVRKEISDLKVTVTRHDILLKEGRQ